MRVHAADAEDSAPALYTVTDRCHKSEGAFNFGVYMVDQVKRVIDERRSAWS